MSSVEKQQLQQRLQQQLQDVDSAQQESTREADGLRVQLAAKDVLHRYGQVLAKPVNNTSKQLTLAQQKVAT